MQATRALGVSLATLAIALSGGCAGHDAPSYDGLGDDAQGQREVSTVRQAVLDGYVDDATSGVVGLGAFEPGRRFHGHCSGALIAPNLVLTARHCVTEQDYSQHGINCDEATFTNMRQPEALVVSPETERPNSPDDPSYVRGVSLHGLPDAEQLCGHDLALIILSRSFTAQEATPIVPRIDEPARATEVFSATGYGLTGTSAASPSGVRMRTDDRSVMCTESSCGAFGVQVEGDSEWLSVDANICSGDSGSPALDSEGRVMGVASRGPDSCDAGIYTDVAAWGTFIIEVALLAAERGAYDAPFWTDGSSSAPEGAPSALVEMGPALEPVIEDDVDEQDVVVEELDQSDECTDCGDDRTRRRADAESEPVLAAEQSCSVAAGRGRGQDAPAGLGALFLFGLIGLRRRSR